MNEQKNLKRYCKSNFTLVLPSLPIPMRFSVHPFHEIKWACVSLWSYKELMQQTFTGDIQQCLTWTIDVFELVESAHVVKFILVNQGQQIGECKIVIDEDKKIYFVSSIVIVPNLQKNWIGKHIYRDVIIPKFTHTHPWYTFVPWPEQTVLGKKLWQ